MSTGRIVARVLRVSSEEAKREQEVGLAAEAATRQRILDQVAEQKRKKQRGGNKRVIIPKVVVQQAEVAGESARRQAIAEYRMVTRMQLQVDSGSFETLYLTPVQGPKLYTAYGRPRLNGQDRSHRVHRIHFENTKARQKAGYGDPIYDEMVFVGPFN